MTALLLAALLAQTNEAEQLFDQFSRAVDAAPGLAARVTAEAKSEELSFRFEGGFAAAPDNRVRIDAALSSSGRTEKMSLVCDGKQTVETLGSDSKPAVEAPADLRDRYLAGAKRLGPTAVAAFASRLKFQPRSRNDLPDFAAALTLGEFQLLADETLGDRKVRALRYAAKAADGPAFDITLWLDATTLLPVQRRVKTLIDGVDITVEEQGAWTAAAQKDEDFALPKQSP